MKFTRKDLQEKAKARPAGYVEDVLARAKIDGDVITLDDVAWRELHEKYYHPVVAPVSPEQVAVSKERFEVCKACPDSLDYGFGCRLYKSCCFGKWRSNPKNQCPATSPKWGPVVESATKEGE